MSLPQPLGGVDAIRLRSAAAGLTALVALAAVGLVAGPSAADPPSAADASACTLTRTSAHHSEGLDTWHPSYPRPGVDGLDAAMVFLSFPDADPAYETADLAADYFPGTAGFFERSSYGRFDLRAHPQPEWIEMPRPSTAYAIRRDWNPERRTAYLRDAVAAADPSVDFSKYDLVYLVADPDAPGVDSDATKVVNFDQPMRADGTAIRRLVTVFEQHPPDRYVLAHETGHVFDLPDLYNRPRDGRGDWDTHVGDWDLMGSQFGLAPDFFGWHKWKFGWLDGRQVRCVGPGTGPFTLEPLADVPEPGTTGGTRLAVVRTGLHTAIAVEARTAAGNDTEICDKGGDGGAGVLVYRIDGRTVSGGGPIRVVDTHPDTSDCADRSVYPPLADAPLRAGETFTVRGSVSTPDVRIEVMDRTRSGGWTVRIGT